MLLIADAEALYRSYHRIVFAYLLRLSGSQEAAEELLQETFYHAIRGAATYRGDSPPSTWLCAIARRLFLNQVRRWSRERARRGDAPWLDLTDPGEGPESAALRHELREQIHDVMENLPETQRLALLLRDADGLPYETIAEMLGMTLANVKVTIHRARLHFRAAYILTKE
ncbi:MAG TPA: RNA polymerase sigma factor [Symbiobacteriaceae bacterium]|nr:RNA polymerase sigma factor [Symbiobacteriaceae bacterium]